MHSLPYINPAHASLDPVMRENDRIVLANSTTTGCRANAVFLMTGLVSKCNLVNPSYYGNTASYMSRRISIFPFHTEHPLAAAYICGALNNDIMLGPLFNGVLSFLTRKETGTSITCK
jgi:hypothetical protein